MTCSKSQEKHFDKKRQKHSPKNNNFLKLPIWQFFYTNIKKFTKISPKKFHKQLIINLTYDIIIFEKKNTLKEEKNKEEQK